MDSSGSFDIIAYLKYRHLRYDTEGKNVSAGWVNTRCIFGCGDRTNHLGINLDSKKMSCWKCGPQGSVINLIMRVEECPYRAAKEIIEEFQEKIYRTRTLEDKPEKDWSKNILPKECTEIIPNLHRQYLSSRGFDPDQLTQKYKLRFCPHYGDYRFRIIVPVFYDNTIVNFVGRDITGKAHVPYLPCPNNEAILAMNSCVYNLDTVRDVALIVEGVFDVWRMGDGTVGTFGEVFTDEQITEIKEKEIKKAVVMYDGEPQAIKQAYKLANKLSVFIPITEVIELEKGDPDTLSSEDINKIKQEVFGH